MTERIRIGAKVPNSGELPIRIGVARMAAMLEAAGFDSIWTSDHVVFPSEVRSRYPFSADGRITWPVDADYLEAVVMLSAMTAGTSRAELGTSVLILPMRNPVLFAKQAACIDAMSGGRLIVGVGAGWLREEFEALDADFDSRGPILDEWLTIARGCWTGAIGPFEGRFYRLAQPILCRPVPAHRLSVLIGGMSQRTLERVGRLADGWVAQCSLEQLSEQEIARARTVIRSAGRTAGRRDAELDQLRVIVRVTGADTQPDVLAARLESLARVGVTDVIVDVDWSKADGAKQSLEVLRSAAA